MKRFMALVRLQAECVKNGNKKEQKNTFDYQNNKEILFFAS